MVTLEEWTRGFRNEDGKILPTLMTYPQHTTFTLDTNTVTSGNLTAQDTELLDLECGLYPI